MMELATHNMLWTLGRKDFTSGVANELELLKAPPHMVSSTTGIRQMALVYGIDSPADAAAAAATRWVDEGWGGGLVQKTATWYAFFVAVTRENVRFRETPQ